MLPSPLREYQEGETKRGKKGAKASWFIKKPKYTQIEAGKIEAQHATKARPYSTEANTTLIMLQ